jgi:hypothetical protein
LDDLLDAYDAQCVRSRAIVDHLGHLDLIREALDGSRGC